MEKEKIEDDEDFDEWFNNLSDEEQKQFVEIEDEVINDLDKKN